MAETEKPMPTKDQVLSWTKRDLRAAIYFLQMIHDHPETLEYIADRFLDTAQGSGALIDQIQKDKAAANGANNS